MVYSGLMINALSRRESIKLLGGLGATALLTTPLAAAMKTLEADTPLFRISLAQWSLHKLLFDQKIDNLDFAAEARAMGFDGIEYVNAFFKDKAEDAAYLRQMNARASDQGVTQLLIMCDGEGNLGDKDESARAQTVENHKKWVYAAKTLGCHSIRVNAASSGTYEEQQKLAADGLRRLTEFAEPHGINVIVENHGGYSSNGAWLSGVLGMVDHPMCGSLPDFGNFCMDWSRADDPDAWYDRYKGTGELMPFAKAVSAKSHEFDDAGNEVRTDYRRMMKLVIDSGYRGWVGVEYEGSQHSPREGSELTKRLLEAVREELTA